MTVQPLAHVLDDDAEIREAVCNVLMGAGYDAKSFGDPQSLLEELRRTPPDILVLDLSLGQSDAVEVIRKLDAVSYRGRVLLISGHDETTLSEIKNVGILRGLAMLDTLRKPFTASDLRKRLAMEPGRSPAVPRQAERETPHIDLAQALDEDWLELWYQPKIDLKTRAIAEAEALIRARHPKLGVVPPSGFLPPPNDPLYQPMSEFVIKRAMRDYAAFCNAGFPLQLSINAPISVIESEGFTYLVRRHLPEERVFSSLVIEVTEEEALRNDALIREVASQLRLYRVFLSIDDFGSGYSSLSRLLDLSFAEVKLDRSFVSGCGTDRLRAAVCQTAIDLAHRFGAHVCAEGVETAPDAGVLARMGCDTAQGFYFARPMPLETSIAFLREARIPDFSQEQTAEAAEG